MMRDVFRPDASLLPLMPAEWRERFEALAAGRSVEILIHQPEGIGQADAVEVAREVQEWIAANGGEQQGDLLNGQHR
jgi:hypothetical protein